MKDKLTNLSLPAKHSTLMSLASAIIQTLPSQYAQSSFETLYGQLDIPWFPMDDIPLVPVPR